MPPRLEIEELKTFRHEPLEHYKPKYYRHRLEEQSDEVVKSIRKAIEIHKQQEHLVPMKPQEALSPEDTETFRERVTEYRLIADAIPQIDRALENLGLSIDFKALKKKYDTGYQIIQSQTILGKHPLIKGYGIN